LRKEPEDVVKPIFKVTSKTGKRQAPDDDEINEGPIKKQRKTSKDLEVG
jgi:hypothetical protein